ncbi:hypothetical protein AQZ49_01855 [Novosphingobium sp. FSW06-99]|nr:hypothetical protein AQZ49_01855 [Novosphingobium sp. FSW06-99]
MKYIVVENAGYEGECDVAKFGTRWAAEQWLDRAYSPHEIATLHIDICMEEDGQRTYDPCGFFDAKGGAA